MDKYPETMNGRSHPAKTKVRCPRCRSRDLELTEFIRASTSWIVIDGKLDREGGIQEYGDHIERMKGQCLQCDHRWRLKKAMQIINVAVSAEVANDD